MCSCASSWRTIEFLPSSVLQNNARWGLICPGPLPSRPADSRAPLQAHSSVARQSLERQLLEAMTCSPHQILAGTWQPRQAAQCQQAGLGCVHMLLGRAGD